MLGRSLFILAFVGISVAGSAAGQVKILLQIDDIGGSSILKGYEGAIEASTLSWGAINDSAPTSGGAQAGRVQFTGISFTKPMDSASPLLLQGLTTGRTIPTVTIRYVITTGDGTQEFSTMTLQDVTLTSQQVSASSELPAEAISLKFRRIQWEVCSFDATGARSGCNTSTWDITKNGP
ncbi:MAG: type VI secretion system tube protein Hcp [Acidobacteria bacterium]|nr:MAG: type VI secretion system tube protein Hcp [Acidobacteriota bacterium]